MAAFFLYKGAAIVSGTKTLLITGASGNLGNKLRRHLLGRYTLRLLDRKPKGKLSIVLADLSTWDEAWVSLSQGTDLSVRPGARWRENGRT